MFAALNSPVRLLRLGAVLLLLAGCSAIGPAKPGDEQRFDVYGRPLKPGQKEEPGLFGAGGLFSTGGKKSDGDQLPVNKHLWRAALDVLSVMPLASTDPFGGVIVTDWSVTPNAPGERLKVSAYITSAELKTDALRVVINRQVAQGAAWVDAPASAEATRRLEDAILNRARELRATAN